MLAPTRQRNFAARYDTLVAQARAANPDPPPDRKRDRLQRESHNLAVAFETHRQSILRYMRDLDVGMTNYADVRVMPRWVAASWCSGVAGWLSSA